MPIVVGGKYLTPAEAALHKKKKVKKKVRKDVAKTAIQTAK